MKISDRLKCVNFIYENQTIVQIQRERDSDLRENTGCLVAKFFWDDIGLLPDMINFMLLYNYMIGRDWNSIFVYISLSSMWIIPGLPL